MDKYLHPCTWKLKFRNKKIVFRYISIKLKILIIKYSKSDISDSSFGISPCKKLDEKSLNLF